jgi:RNA polymerase sigma-70 factor (ECF subfamily)
LARPLLPECSCKKGTTYERRTIFNAGNRQGRRLSDLLLLRMLLLRRVLLPALLPNRQSANGAHGQVLLNAMTNVAPIAADVWDALSEELHRFLRSRLPSEADADDLLQNVFIRVIEEIRALRQSDRLAAWVYQIARREIVDFYRRRSPRPQESVEEAVDGGSGIGNMNHAVGTWLSAMIDELPGTLREAVRLYEVENLPQAEIASRLQISLSGAKSRVQRGRRQLEDLLRGCCQIELDRRGNVIDCQPAKTDSCREASCQCRD